MPRFTVTYDRQEYDCGRPHSIARRAATIEADSQAHALELFEIAWLKAPMMRRNVKIVSVESI